MLPSNVLCLNQGISAISSYAEEESCPDPYTLPMRCLVSRPTSWCLSDAECPSVNSMHPRKWVIACLACSKAAESENTSGILQLCCEQFYVIQKAKHIVELRSFQSLMLIILSIEWNWNRLFAKLLSLVEDRNSIKYYRSVRVSSYLRIRS